MSHAYMMTFLVIKVFLVRLVLGALAQLGERLICIQEVISSTLICSTMNYYGPLAQLVEQFPFKEWVDGSSPSRLTNFKKLVDILKLPHLSRR